jgi:protein-L-isoaspartate(D-aspartate) O-methyltransferase
MCAPIPEAPPSHRLKTGMTNRRLCQALALVLSVSTLIGTAAQVIADEEHAGRRARMIQVIEAHARTAGSALGRNHIDRRVLDVMADVPRHLFVSEHLRRKGYDDRPLPIGHGQTISQPFIVALMTDLLGIEPDHKVLEVGTGSGYQAAVLAHLAARVCSIEIIPELARTSGNRLERLGYGNIRTTTGDGYFGWPECGPFDGIIVTAAAGQVPPPLLQQLKPGGRMVIPVGGAFLLQHLMLVTKLPDGRLQTRQMLPVRFVPLTRK